MATLTIPIDDELYDKIQALSWVKWSKVAQDGIQKRKILEVYIRDKSISEEDAEFCEMIDWHPADELPIKEEVIERILRSDKNTAVPVKDISDIFK
ncbi:hypothetical protein [Methanolobus chelungpuianus]|uniref:Uncharacterized protein n=1 Tax=Methanolobus chelungpuianus TaxID=502115 RepID=A0AAE3HCH5_9EURY|nr:hypothetical protein [Methanolobus chelungpuianus]MCQ6963498.1 hypothetical protein [Methanolobus chelungpuianus]